METKKIDPNATATAAADNSGITNTTGVYDDSNAPTPILKTNPTPVAEPYSEHEGSEDDDDEDNDDANDGFEEVEPTEEDTIDSISIRSDDEDSDDEEITHEEE